MLLRHVVYNAAFQKQLIHAIIVRAIYCKLNLRMANVNQVSNCLPNKPALDQKMSLSFKCPECSTCFIPALLKVANVCPRKQCNNTTAQTSNNAATSYCCKTHGDLRGDIVKLDSYKCPVFACNATIRKQCNKCVKFYSCSNFSKRMVIKFVYYFDRSLHC